MKLFQKKPKAPTNRRKCIWISVLSAIIVLAIVIPIAVVFGRRAAMKKGETTVFVPLYIYPAPGAWDPLYDAATARPDLHFTVVVNPNSGPGVDPLPDGNYTREIERLSRYENIQKLGYIATTWGTKSMENASREISTYAGWADQNQSLALDGVFLDETPNEYEAPRAELLTNIRSEVESTAGLGTYIVHNPGMVPDPRYMESADLTVVFEEAYRTFENQNSNTVSRVRDLQQDRQDLCMLVHSVPDSEMEGDQLHELVDQLQDLAGSIFLTNLAVDYYHSFSSQFGDFVRAI